MTKVSVALAAYNGTEYIEKQLRSLMAQTRRIDEVIIRDDGSTDETVRIAQEFIDAHALEGWRVLRAEKNGGYFENFHQAIMEASGDVIFLCDQDDIWDVRKVERCMQELEKDKSLLLVCTGYDTIDGEDKPCDAPGVRFVDRNFDGRVEKLAAASFIGCSYVRGFSIAMRKTVRERVCWKNPGKLLSHDWLLCLCASVMGENALETPRCAFIHENLAHYRVHGSNVTARTDGQGLIRTDVRVKALADSKAAHEAVLAAFLGAHPALTAQEKAFARAMRRQIAFEGRRLRFMASQNPLHFLPLLVSAGMYRCYYKSLSGALRVMAGDLVYTYRRNDK